MPVVIIVCWIDRVHAYTDHGNLVIKKNRTKENEMNDKDRISISFIQWKYNYPYFLYTANVAVKPFYKYGAHWRIIIPSSWWTRICYGYIVTDLMIWAFVFRNKRVRWKIIWNLTFEEELNHTSATTTPLPTHTYIRRQIFYYYKPNLSKRREMD